MLNKLTSIFQDDDKKGLAMNKQLADFASKRWGKSLVKTKFILSLQNTTHQRTAPTSQRHKSRNLAGSHSTTIKGKPTIGNVELELTIFPGLIL